MTTNTFPHVIQVGSLSELASVHVAELDYGTRAFVVAPDENFYLQPTSSFPVDGISVISPVTQAIVGKPGAVWVIAALSGGAGAGGGDTIVLAGDEQNATAVLAPSSLQIPVAAGQHVRVEWNIRLTSDIANGMQFAITAPAGAAGIVNATVYPGGSAQPVTGSDLTLNGAALDAPGGSTSELDATVVAGVINGSTAGFIGLQFAKSVNAVGVDTRLRGGSTVMGTFQVI